jgi:Tol biopolymer transport system component
VGEDFATHLYLFDLQGRVQQLPIQEVPGGHVAWHPDGEQIAYDVYNDTVTVISEIRGLDLRTFEVQMLTHSGGIAEYPEWSLDGKYLVFLQGAQTPGTWLTLSYSLNIYDLNTGRITTLLPKGLARLAPAWIPRSTSSNATPPPTPLPTRPRSAAIAPSGPGSPMAEGRR